MVYIDSFHLVLAPGSSTPRLVYDDPPSCPLCGSGAALDYIDSVRRHYLRLGGTSAWIEIPRGRCPVCRVIHRIMPASIPPFKHYLTSVIAGFLCGGQEMTDRPCEMTVLGWRSWFELNTGILREHGCERNKKDLPGSAWLGETLKIVYNSGGRLRPARP